MKNAIGKPRSIVKMIEFETEAVKKKFDSILQEFCLCRSFYSSSDSLLHCLSFAILAHQLRQSNTHALLNQTDHPTLRYHSQQILHINDSQHTAIQQAKIAGYCHRFPELLTFMSQALGSDKMWENDAEHLEAICSKFKLSVRILEPGQSDQTIGKSSSLTINLLRMQDGYCLIYSSSPENLELAKNLCRIPLAALDLSEELLIPKILDGKLDSLLDQMKTEENIHYISREEGSVVISKFSRPIDKESSSMTSSKQTSPPNNSTTLSKDNPALQKNVAPIQPKHQSQRAQSKCSKISQQLHSKQKQRPREDKLQRLSNYECKPQSSQLAQKRQMVNKKYPNKQVQTSVNYQNQTNKAAYRKCLFCRNPFAIQQARSLICAKYYYYQLSKTEQPIKASFVFNWTKWQWLLLSSTSTSTVSFLFASTF